MRASVTYFLAAILTFTPRRCTGLRHAATALTEMSLDADAAGVVDVAGLRVETQKEAMTSAKPIAGIRNDDAHYKISSIADKMMGSAPGTCTRYFWASATPTSSCTPR